MSKGEDKIVRLLISARVRYDREVIVPRLTGKKGAPLRYDFGIYHNGKLIALIDFDGDQHFKYTSLFQQKYLVTSIYQNDRFIREKFGGI